jgi:SAM-dependent methyltransferase
MLIRSQEVQVSEPDFANQLRSSPICDNWGMSRGVPIDRYYIDAFLSRHAADIRGHVLEIGDSGYTGRFGGTHVERVDILDINSQNPEATLVADLCDAPHVPSNTFNCIILTQVLIYIPDLQAAIRTLIRILKPGGVIISTQPGISHVMIPIEQDSWCWSIYPKSARWLFSDSQIDRRNLIVESYGNLRTVTAFLWGLAQEDLAGADFQIDDPRYPLITAVRATKLES